MNKYDVLIDAQHFDKVSEVIRTSGKASNIFVLKTSDDPIKLEFDLSDINLMNKKIKTLDVPVPIREDMKMTMIYASAYLQAVREEGIVGIVERALVSIDTSNIIYDLIGTVLKPPSTLRIFTDRDEMADIAHDNFFETYIDISLISSSDEIPRETHGMRGPNGLVARDMLSTAQNIMYSMRSNYKLPN